MDDKSSKKLWGGRFSESSSGITEKISSSIGFDSRLYRQDIRGTVAHAKMLHRMGILNKKELTDILRALGDIENEIREGGFIFDESLEDIHMNIEASLTKRTGEAGKKIHTARSRNDQIALDMRLYIRDETGEIKNLLGKLIRLLVETAERNIDAVMPGYTHLQIAQPVRFSHHMLAYAWMLVRDAERLGATGKACGRLPLGCGALAGVNYANDRAFLKDELEMDEVIMNSMDAVSDRDFILDFLYFSAALGAHLSRFCEELVLWSAPEFGYIRLADRVTTGSSIMPQKRNPDLAELIRGKTGRLYGNLVSVLTLVKGLPMTYNRDLQEDKEPLFDSIDTVKLCLEGIAEMIATMKVNTEIMKQALYKNFSTATDVADYLVIKGMPFRQAHETVGGIVRHCEEKNEDFFNLPLQVLMKFSTLFDADAAGVFNPETSPERKLSAGSTSRKEILRQIELLRDVKLT